MANTKTENLYMQLNASELSAIIMKGSPNSNDRDAGFCSGSSEGGDDLSNDHHLRLEPSSPTDASEDSVEVKVSPIALIRNKRKSSEPSKVICERKQQSPALCGPLKKRIRYTSATDSAVVLTPPAIATPPAETVTTQPQSHEPKQKQHPQQLQSLWDPSQVLPHELMPNPAQVFVRHPGATTLHRLPAASLDGDVQQEPLALVLKKPTTPPTTLNLSTHDNAKQNEVKSTPGKSYAAAGSPIKTFTPKKTQERCEHDNDNDDDDCVNYKAHSKSATHEPPRPCGSVSVDSATFDESIAHATLPNGASRPQQRNYKNMTRERRIEANARERTRVHTISAAYETLRQAVPSYSHAQKLSKLSVLRVACSYILTLSRMAGQDYSEDQSAPSIADCMEAVTATIQTEGKIRKKKEDDEK